MKSFNLVSERGQSRRGILHDNSKKRLQNLHHCMTLMTSWLVVSRGDFQNVEKSYM